MKYILIVYRCLVRVIISDTVFYKFSQIIYLRSNYPHGFMGWNQLCRRLGQLLIDLIAGRVSSLLSKFGYAFMLLWTFF
jgi:hypothetical protein